MVAICKGSLYNTVSKVFIAINLYHVLSSWNEAICRDKLLFLAKLLWQNSHWNGCFLSWTEAICRDMLLLSEKLLWQNSHWNGFFPSCTEAIW